MKQIILTKSEQLIYKKIYKQYKQFWSFLDYGCQDKINSDIRMAIKTAIVECRNIR